MPSINKRKRSASPQYSANTSTIVSTATLPSLAPTSGDPPPPPKRTRRAVAAKADARTKELVKQQAKVSSTSHGQHQSPTASSSHDSPPSIKETTKQRVRKNAQSQVGASAPAPGKKEVEKAREEKWRAWCDEHRWRKDMVPNYEQKLWSIEVHRVDAMSFYRLKGFEMDTLPYVAFDNAFNHNSFGRSYNHGNVRTLVARKFAYRAGLDEQIDPKTQEVEFITEGWKLHEAHVKELEERMRAKGKQRKALKSCKIIPARRTNTDLLGRPVKDRPFGAWTTPMYDDDDAYIGDWLNLQFDPDAGEFEDFYAGFERSRPVDAEWEWRGL